MAEELGRSGWWAAVRQTVLQQHERPPWLLRYRSSSAFICASVAMAVFTVCLAASSHYVFDCFEILICHASVT